MVKRKIAEKPRDRLDLRFRKRNTKHQMVKMYVHRLMQDGIVINDLIVELLDSHRTGELNQFNTPGKPSAIETIDEREREARKQQLKKLKFTGMGGDG